MKHLFLFFIGLSSILQAQITISGKVYDKAANEAIPFASIGIKGKSVGTVSDENGVFTIVLKDINDADSLKISAIGYRLKSFAISKAKSFTNEMIYLDQSSVNLAEVVVKPTKTITKILGNKNYNTNVQCSFQGNDKNFLGVEAAIRANNKRDREVWIEDFNFYLNKNTIEDSVTFRLNFYKEDKDGLPGENLLSKPIIFKIAKKQTGVVSLNLKKYNLHTKGDFFISMECLSNKVNKDNLTFSGSIMGPAFFKMASFANWEKISLMGLDFNVTVTYQK
jgi:hypothetical protein